MIRRWLKRRREVKAMQSGAYRDAFEVCSAAGPQATANSYGFAYSGDVDALAMRVAAATYQREAVAEGYHGARDGFEAWLATEGRAA